MSRNLALALMGILVVGSFVGGTTWFLSSWKASVFESNRLDIQLCDCSPDSLTWELAEIQALLEFYHKKDVSGNVDFLVPFVQTKEPEGYAIPSNGMGWIAQAWAPSTYRREYRENDQELFWAGKFKSDPDFQKFQSALLKDLPKCEAFDKGFAQVNEIIMGAANAKPLDEAFTSIEEWSSEALHPAIESDKLTAGDRVLVRLNCVAYKVGGCMNEKACNFNPLANVDGEPCIPKDECGKCDDTDPTKTGPGKVYDCGCNPKPSGDCDCRGNKADAAGDCGGDCLEVDDSGKCIQYSDRDGDGVWDREDRCPDEKAQGDGGDGCKMSVDLNSAELHFTMSGTIPGQKIGYTIKRAGNTLKQGRTKSHLRFPTSKVVSDEGNRLQTSLGTQGGDITIEIQFYNRDNTKAGAPEVFENLSWGCGKGGECGPRQM